MRLCGIATRFRHKLNLPCDDLGIAFFRRTATVLVGVCALLVARFIPSLQGPGRPCGCAAPQPTPQLVLQVSQTSLSLSSGNSIVPYCYIESQVRRMSLYKTEETLVPVKRIFSFRACISNIFVNMFCISHWGLFFFGPQNTRYSQPLIETIKPHKK